MAIQFFVDLAATFYVWLKLLKDEDGRQDFCLVEWMVPKNKVSQCCT
jgi:hypothetical protein